MLEPAILIHALKNRSFFLKIKPYLQTKGKKSFFQEAKLQKIFNNVCIWYDKYKRFPKEKEMLMNLSKQLYSFVEVRFYASNEPLWGQCQNNSNWHMRIPK